MSNSNLGIGGAPTRATTFPSDAKGRKSRPVASGVLDYFPDAIVAIAEVSWRGNEQHNPGMPLHWDRSKSGDEIDALSRHLLQRGSLDDDGLRHSAKLAWRALAHLQKEIEAENRAEKIAKVRAGVERICGVPTHGVLDDAIAKECEAKPPFVPIADPAIRRPGDCLIPPYNQEDLKKSGGSCCGARSHHTVPLSLKERPER